MAEEIVRVIKVETKNSGKSIRDLRKEINALKKELEQTAVGTEEFESTLKQLTQTQKSYNEVQQQIRDMSRTNQQDMVKFASFARNLGKSYSALNAAVGLFADKNEDVSKAMLKVQRTIQLVQGLDGIAGLVRDLPKVLAGFKSWLNALDPVEKRINNIAKGINGISPEKLKQINEANRLAAEAAKGGSTTTAAAGAGERQYLPAENKELAKQVNTYYPALLKQEKDLLSQRKSALKALEKQKTVLEKSQTDLRAMEKQYKDVTATLQLVGASGLSDPEKITAFNDRMKELGYNIKIDEVNMQGFTNQLADMTKTVENNGKAYNDNKTALAELDKQLATTRKQIAEASIGMSAFEKTFPKAARAAKAAAGMIKTALYSIGIGLIIAGLVKAYEWIKEIYEKGKELEKLNKEISQSTNQMASKGIVVLKELSLAYQKVGDSAEEKQKFIEKYADKIKETGIEIKDVKTAEDVLVNNTDKYVDAIMKRAKAQAVENAAVKIYQDYLDERYDLESKFEKDKNKSAGTTSKEEYITLLKGMGMTAEEAEQAWASATNKTQQKILNQIDAADKKVQDRMKKMFEDVAQLEKEYAGMFASVTTTNNNPDDNDWKAWLEQKQRDLETLKKANEDALQLFMDDRTKELQGVAKHYDELIELAKKYGEDTTLLELARQKEIQAIVDKYNDEALKKEEERINSQYELIQTQIERIRRMSDTSNLREPTEQMYQTWYKQPPVTRSLGLFGLATGQDWANIYQTKEDVEMQYKAQIEYNDTLYLLTKQRIEQENKLLEEQLKIVGLDADKKLEIQRTLVENEMALSDAQLKNEQDNTKAYLEAQEKKRQALNGVLEVASTMTSALANIAKIEAQTAEEGSQRQKNATKAYKAFAITQAIADTYKSANESYAAMASIPYVGPALGIAAAAAAIVSGIANVKSIISESISGSSVNGGTSATVTAPSALSTPPIEYTRSLLGDKELDELNQPLKCYVLESDITKTQNKVKVAENNATF